jgi:uncharacterized protein (DUF305 family)
MPNRATSKLLAVLVGIVVVVAACGGSKTGHNAADVTFVQQMVPHHTQAVAMATLAPGQASSPAVKALAKRIEAAQAPELNKMQGWLKDWGKSEAKTTMDMGKGGMGDGMMSDAEMAQLTKASGARFDRLFLTMMTKHHQGALVMAGTELDKGKDKHAKALAQSIRDSQTKEIAEMRTLLAKQ